VFLTIVALAACQPGGGGTPAVSLEEAKQMAAELSTVRFEPPPRTIADLRGLIGALPAAPDDCAVVQEDRAFDMAQASERLAKGTATISQASFATSLIVIAEQELARGNFRNAIDLVQKGLQSLSNATGRQRIAFHTWLTRVRASLGDTAGARSAFTAAKGAGRFNETLENQYRFDRLDAVGRAALAQADGNLVEAEGYLRQALKYPTRGGSLFVDRDRQGADLAANLFQQGRLTEAELQARNAVKLAFNNVNPMLVHTAQTAQPVAQLADVLLEQGRVDDAEYMARTAIRLHEIDCSLPSSLALAKSRRILARVLAAKEDWQGVLAQLESVRAALADEPSAFKHLFGDNLEFALALVHSGRAVEGLGLFETALARTEERRGIASYEAAEARGLLAMARAATGDTGSALKNFASALPVLIGGRDHLADAVGQSTQGNRARKILDAYMELLAGLRGTPEEAASGIDTASELLRVSSVARLGTVHQALAAAAARSAPGDPALADLVRREQDAARETRVVLDTLSHLEYAPADQVDLSLARPLRQRIVQLRAARTKLFEEIRGRFPEFAQLTTPRPVALSEVQNLLRPEEALIATYVGEERTYVWAVPKEGPVAFAVADMGRLDLSDTVALLRSALEPNAETLGDIPDFDLADGYNLYAALLEPVKQGWEKAKSLLIVTHGPLGYLPFSLLPTEAVSLPPERGALFSRYRHVPWLARTHAVTVLPSVTSLKTLRGLPSGNAGRRPFAGFGDPLFSLEQARAIDQRKRQRTEVAGLTARGLVVRGLPLGLRAAPNTAGMDSAELARLPRLSDTADEILGIAVALKADLSKDVFLRERAHEGAIKAMDLSGYKVLSIATHGLVSGDLNGLTQPALALSAPELVNDNTNDGLLTMSEILGLKLDADWVVLSACNTASGQGAGAEAVSGLGQAFFYAGTRALLVSNWPVETRSAKALTTDLFERQGKNPGLSRARALQQAMLTLIDGPGSVDAEGKTLFSYAHPLFWAPFSLIGDGGGDVPQS
jgi:CHAT domain-containing protein